jgi:hypothetical protein
MAYTIYSLTVLGGAEEEYEKSAKISGPRVEIQTHDLPNMKRGANNQTVTFFYCADAKLEHSTKFYYDS